MAIIDATKTIINMLLADSGVNAMVRSKVFPVMPRDSVEMPLLAVNCDSTAVRYGKGFVQGYTQKVNVAVMATSYTEATTLSSAVIAAMDAAHIHIVDYAEQFYDPDQFTNVITMEVEDGRI